MADPANNGAAMSRPLSEVNNVDLSGHQANGTRGQPTQVDERRQVAVVRNAERTDRAITRVVHVEVSLVVRDVRVARCGARVSRHSRRIEQLQRTVNGNAQSTHRIAAGIAHVSESSITSD